eukprot:10087921-Alexandrium_andersonii.AAC.1
MEPTATETEPTEPSTSLSMHECACIKRLRLAATCAANRSAQRSHRICATRMRGPFQEWSAGCLLQVAIKAY